MLRSIRKKIFEKNTKFFRVNERIRVPEVVVIDENGQNLGIIPTTQALTLARERDLDLVEVSPVDRPPVCKIQDYGQFQYQQSRKLQAQKAGGKKLDNKSIRISFKIGRHDLELKKNQTQKFLEKGHKVMVEMILKGREKQHRGRAIEMMREFTNSITENIVIEQPVKALGSKISTLIYLPKK